MNKRESSEKKAKIKKNIIIFIMPLLIATVPVLLNNHFNSKPIPLIIRHTNDLENYDILSYFPIAEGNSWEYSCYYEFQEEDNNSILNSTNSFIMKVLKRHEFDGFYIFEMVGDPFIIDRDTVDKKYGLLLISNKIYHIPNSIYKEVLSTLTNTQSIDYSLLQELISRINLVAEMPFYDNQQIGDLYSLMYQKDKYKWNVEAERINYQEVDGQITNGNRYRIYYRSVADYTEYGFIPHIGFDSFYYEKNGSGDILSDIKLINYNISN